MQTIKVYDSNYRILKRMAVQKGVSVAEIVDDILFEYVAEVGDLNILLGKDEFT